MESPLNILLSIEIALNYPENLLIHTVENLDGQLAAYLHRGNENGTTTMLVSTSPIFDSHEEAYDFIEVMCLMCKEDQENCLATI